MAELDKEVFQAFADADMGCANVEEQEEGVKRRRVLQELDVGQNASIPAIEVPRDQHENATVIATPDEVTSERAERKRKAETNDESDDPASR